MAAKNYSPPGPAIKELVKRAVNRLGYTVTRNFSPEHRTGFSPAPEDRYKWFQELGIRTVLDVGAHTGESAVRLHGLLPRATIYSFEPLADRFQTLKQALANSELHHCFNVALGESPGRSTMNRSSFSQSSSLLRMAELHKVTYPFTSGQHLEAVDVETLDRMAERLDLRPEVLLKIDVQGYEKSVLLGAERTLAHVRLIIVEASFFELYEGQPLFGDVAHLLEERGFVYAGAWDQSHSPRDGAPLQQDALFIRRP